MNECIKTGFRFRQTGGYTFTGDLFYRPLIGAFQIMGVPDGTLDNNPVDAEIAITRFHKRPGANARYSDSVPGVKLLAVSPDFRAHVEEGSPEIAGLLPEETLHATD